MAKGIVHCLEIIQINKKQHRGRHHRCLPKDSIDLGIYCLAVIQTCKGINPCMKERVAEALLLPALLQVLCRDILAHKENLSFLSVKVYIAQQFTGIPAVHPLLTIGYHQLAFTLQHIQDIVHRCLLQKQVPVLRHHILPDTCLQLLFIIS